MLRISKLTDYAIVVLVYCARDPEQIHTTRELSERSGVPMPTVGKVMKLLSRAELLTSKRGVHGGYGLARPTTQISAADIILAIEGPIALTECSLYGGEELECEVETGCPVKSHWRRITREIERSLQAVKLSDLANPEPVDQGLVALRSEGTHIPPSTPSSSEEEAADSEVLGAATARRWPTVG